MQTQAGVTSLPPLAVGKKEAARLLGVSVRTIENYVAVKRITARKIGKRTVILVRSLEHFLRADQPSPLAEVRK